MLSRKQICTLKTVMGDVTDTMSIFFTVYGLYSTYDIEHYRICS